MEKKPFCALYNIYNENYWLPYSVASIYSTVDVIIILVSEVPWYGSKVDQRDTFKCIEALHDPQKKIKILCGIWPSEVEQRNFSLAVASNLGAKEVLIIDADEIYHSNDIIKAREFTASQKDIDCWHINWITYWKTVRYRIEPIESYQPVVIVNLGSVGYVETRNPIGAKHALIPPEVAICHHMSHALSDERLALKHISVPNHSQTAYSSWFNEKWKAWDINHEMTDLHPINPSEFKRAVPISRELVPAIIHKIYDGTGLP